MIIFYIKKQSINMYDFLLFSFTYRTYKNRKWQIHKFLGSFCNRKSANFLGVPVRKSQIRKFFMINPQTANPRISIKYCTVRKSRKDWVRKSQMSKVSHSQSDKLFMSANLRICDSRNLVADRPPLVHCMYKTLRSKKVFF